MVLTKNIIASCFLAKRRLSDVDYNKGGKARQGGLPCPISFAILLADRRGEGAVAAI